MESGAFYVSHVGGVSPPSPLRKLGAISRHMKSRKRKAHTRAERRIMARTGMSKGRPNFITPSLNRGSRQIPETPADLKDDGAKFWIRTFTHALDLAGMGGSAKGRA